MKNILTYREFINENLNVINEIKGSFTITANADKIIQSVDAAIKGGLFFGADLGNKVYMKEGGKRPVAAEKWRKYIILCANHELKDLGREIEFEYDYTTFTTDKRNVKELNAKDYLEYRLGLMFDQMHANTSQDWDKGAEAAAAGTYAFKPTDNVTPYVDCGFIVWFADKYKIDLKKFMHDQQYVYLSYDDVIRYAEKYPFKK
jgi:hypothetical protein